MKRLSAAGLTVLALFTSSAFAGPILIINGSSVTAEPATTASITSNLAAVHAAVGNTVTISDGVPTNLSDYEQVWDIRFSNSAPITASQRTQYLEYLQAGGGMFVMGENEAFPTRNVSVLTLIQLAGGGTLTFSVPSGVQTVNAPFTGPNPVTTVSYAAPGGVTGPGTGQCITQDSVGRCAGVAFAVGTLANATEGALTTIFDVNFMQLNAEEASQNLLRNLVRFVGRQVGPPPVQVSEPSSMMLILMGAGLMMLTCMGRRRPAA